MDWLQEKENLEKIKQVYNLLNEHLKLGMPIHPAGEWLLDNFYVVEETTNQIKKDLGLNRYTNFGFSAIIRLENRIFRCLYEMQEESWK